MEQPPKPRVVYDANTLRRDLVAGLTVAAVAVPQAMAYALIAGIPPQYGLYTAIIVTALGSVFGSSDHLVNGPTNAISLVVFSAVAGIGRGPGDTLEAIFLLALIVGVIQVLIALFKLGDLTRYVSESVILGFMAGAGFLVALEQLHNLLGLQQQGDGHLHFLHRFWLTIATGGPVNGYAAGLGVATIVVVVVLRQLGNRIRVQIPDMLIGLLASSALVAWFGWAGEGDDPVLLEVVGAVPTTLPRFHLPPFHYDWIRKLSGSALAIALLGLLEALAISKSIASRTHQALDFNKQCLAEGLSNIGGGILQCMPGSGSLTRSAINFQAGAVTRLSGVYSAIAVAIVILLFAPLARYVPKAALAGILIVTAWRLVDKPRLAYCVRATRFDAYLAISTALASVLISIEFSILIGTFLSFLLFVPRAARLKADEITVGQDRVLRERNPEDPQCTLMALFSLEGELFFGAAPELELHLEEIERRVEQGAKVVVLRLKRVRNPDMVCLEIFERFIRFMQQRNIPVLFCGVRPDFAAVLNNVHFHLHLPPECLFLEEATTGSSTLRAVRRAYEILGRERCPTCPRPAEPEPAGPEFTYMI